MHAMSYKTFIVGVALAVGAAGVAHAQLSDQQFVTKLAGVGMTEVELGKLAKDKASNGDVKGFAQRMIDDHSKAGDELKAIAQRKNFSWPSALPPESVAEKEKLSKLSGAAFDQAYMDAMAKGHRELLPSVKAHAQSGADAEVKAWATKASSSIEAHLVHAEKVQREVGRTATH
jgi:putative membrane protein